MPNKILKNIEEGLDLANYLYNQVKEEENKKEKNNQMRYLGQTLKTLKDHIKNAIRTDELSQEHTSGGESPINLPK